LESRFDGLSSTPHTETRHGHPAKEDDEIEKLEEDPPPEKTLKNTGQQCLANWNPSAFSEGADKHIPSSTLTNPSTYRRGSSLQSRGRIPYLQS
jgi:hypothetical protein